MPYEGDTLRDADPGPGSAAEAAAPGTEDGRSKASKEAEAAADVAAALRALKYEVRRQRHALEGEGAVAADAWLGPANLQAVQITAHVDPHQPIAWPEWPPGIVPKITAFLKKVTRRLLRWYINPIVEQQNAFNAATAQALSDLTVEMRAGDVRIGERLDGEAAARVDELSRLSRDLRTQKLANDSLKRKYEALAQALADQAARLDDSDVAAPRSPAEGDVVPREPTDYYLFELYHRGRDEDIRARQQPYLEHFGSCQTVLDIGCGRGEFVALLQEHGIEARGVDANPDMVAHCRAAGLPVEHADAIAYLQGLSDAAVDGIFMAQIAEHLEPADLAQLLRQARRTMSPDGVLVIETINPTCVWAFVQYYLMDPTHIWPIHPATLRFMVEDAGFWDAQVEFHSPTPPEQRLAHLPVEGLPSAQVAALNDNVDRLNELLFGYQDYAVVARRPPEDLAPHDEAA